MPSHRIILLFILIISLFQRSKTIKRGNLKIKEIKKTEKDDTKVPKSRLLNSVNKEPNEENDRSPVT